MKNVWFAIKWAILIVIIMFLAVNLWNLFARNVLKQEWPTIFGVSSAVVMSGSMEPTFAKGDYVILHSQSSYEVGDIIAFKDGNSYTTHRIVGVTEQGFITKGDANNATDQIAGKDYVTMDKTVGKVVVVLQDAGGVINFLHEPAGLIIIFVVGASLIILPALFSNKKEVQYEQTK